VFRAKQLYVEEQFVRSLFLAVNLDSFPRQVVRSYAMHAFPEQPDPEDERQNVSSRRRNL
jgi:hypothetical protein